MDQEQGSQVDPIQVLRRAGELERIIQEDPPDKQDSDARLKHVESIQAKLRGFCEGKKIAPRTIRGRSPLRAFWFQVTYKNI